MLADAGPGGPSCAWPAEGCARATMALSDMSRPNSKLRLAQKRRHMAFSTSCPGRTMNEVQVNAGSLNFPHVSAGCSAASSRKSLANQGGLPLKPAPLQPVGTGPGRWAAVGARRIQENADVWLVKVGNRIAALVLLVNYLVELLLQLLHGSSVSLCSAGFAAA